MSPQELRDLITRHQVLLERFKTAQALEQLAIFPKLEEAVTSTFNSLASYNLSELDKNELWKLIGDLRRTQGEILADSRAKHVAALRELSGYEGTSEASLLKLITKGDLPGKRRSKEVYFPTLDEAWKSCIENPVRATGQMLDPFIKSWGESHIAAVEGAIMKGYSDGSTIGQIIQQIRGTKAKGFQDGITAMSRRHAEAVTRTAVQHVSQRSRMETWEANDDLVSGFTFVATLDSRTTAQCRSLDGKIFPLGKGPVPPVHVNCRSTTIPKLHSDFDFLDEGATRASKDGPVDAKQTYYDWLKTQPESVVAEALGKAKAKDFLAGKITAADFDKLNLGRTFAPMSLEEMKKAEKKVFSLAKPIAPPPPPLPPKPPVIAPPPPPKPAPVPLPVAPAPVKGIKRSEEIRANMQKGIEWLSKYRFSTNGVEAALAELNKSYKFGWGSSDAMTKSVRAKMFEALALPEELQAKTTPWMRFTNDDVDKLLGINALTSFDQARTSLMQIVHKDILDNLPTLFCFENKEGRAHYHENKLGRNLISMTRTNPARVWAHEIAHHIEVYGANVSEKSLAFLKKRAGSESLQKMSTLTGNRNYKSWEVAYKDEFERKGGNHYMGKFYSGSRSTELISSGVERLMLDPYGFQKDDPDYFDFIIDALQNPSPVTSKKGP